tara:strand:+ start:70 stop:642 length:573 start_codon:yes stop_codon:yes gene_type:complete
MLKVYISIVTILKIAKIGHPILLQKTKEVKEIGSDYIKKIIFDMSETMIDANGVGLAAPQVHLNKSIIIFRNLEEIKKNEKIHITAVINPSIEYLSDEFQDHWEGCLSIPGMLGLVRRNLKIKYSGFDIEGKKINNEVEGLQARIIQHEFDHLNGILYTQRLAHKDAFGYEEEIEKFWKENEKDNKKNTE